MNRSRVWLPSWVYASAIVALASITGAVAQEASSSADAPGAAETSAAPADERRRDRRRKAEEAVSAPAAAAAAATPSSTTSAAETGEPKLICKNIKPIGSRVARRICGTEEQWAADNARTSADAEESMRQMRGRSGITTGGSSGPASLGQPSFGQ